MLDNHFFEKLGNSEEHFDTIRKHRYVICYGAGSKAKQTLPLLHRKGIVPVAVCDGNAALWGTELIGNLPVMSFQEAKQRYPGCGILLTVTLRAAQEIYEQLQCDTTQQIYHVINPFKVETKFLSMEELYSEKEEWKENYAALSDDLSREILLKLLRFKMTGNQLPLDAGVVNNGLLERFGEDILASQLAQKPITACYVDVGTFTGDTICSFLAFCGGRYGKIIGFEPDIASYAAAYDFIKYGRIENVTLHNIALWSKQGEKPFYSFGAATKEYYESSNMFEHVEHITARNTLQNSGPPSASTTHCHTLDEMLKNECPALLKIDALAADTDILLGGEQIIRRHKPTIIMEFATLSSNMTVPIRFLKNLHSDYHFYLRAVAGLYNTRVFLYAL